MAGVKEVASAAGFGGNTSDVADVFEGLIKTVKAEGKVIIKGCGTFTYKEKPARTARNPQTGAAVEVPAKNVIVFKQSKETIDVMEPAKKSKRKK